MSTSDCRTSLPCSSARSWFRCGTPIIPGTILFRSPRQARERSSGRLRRWAGTPHHSPNVPAALESPRGREKAHTQEGDALAAARRRLPMVEVDASLALNGPHGPVTPPRRVRRASTARRLFLHVAHGSPAAEQCEVAHGSPPRWRSCPTFTPATSPTPSSVRIRTTRAAVTATSWGARPVVLRPGIARRDPGRTPSRHDAHRVLRPARATHRRSLRDDHSWRGGHGLQLRAHGPHRVRTTGDMGRTVPRLPATMHLHAHCRWRSHVGSDVAGRTPDRPVVATRSWMLLISCVLPVLGVRLGSGRRGRRRRHLGPAPDGETQ